MYTKHGIVEDYRFFLHAFVIFEIAKLGLLMSSDKWLFLRPRQAAIFTWAGCNCYLGRPQNFPGMRVRIASEQYSRGQRAVISRAASSILGYDVAWFGFAFAYSQIHNSQFIFRPPHLRLAWGVLIYINICINI